MKIHGQEFHDIFKKLPWQYQIVVVVAAAFILFVVCYIPWLIFSRVEAPPTPAPLQMFRDDGASSSVFDPALAFDPRTNTVWMAYATTEASAQNPNEILMQVRTARATDGACKNWEQIDDGVSGKADDLLAPDGQSVFRSGVWRVETPAIVHDPDDAGREWKLYAYKYFWPHDQNQAIAIAQHYGVIVYKYASDPGKGWSAEQWLMSPGDDYPPPPYNQMVAQKLNNLDPSLQDIASYARPSVIYQDGILVMSLSAFTKDAVTPDRIVMLGSQDHGRSWSYLGTPLRAAEIPALGAYTKLAGATLVKQGGQILLAVVLGDEQRQGQGAFIFGFDDVGKGLLQRKSNVPVLKKQLPLNAPNPGRMGGGFAAYTDACSFGVLTSEQRLGTPNFQIFKNYQKPLPQ